MARLSVVCHEQGGIRLKARLVSIQVGQSVEHETVGRDGTAEIWTSGIVKVPVDGPVWVGRVNLEGDTQADLKHHGGPDKAVMAYAATHYPTWQTLLDKELPRGAFGENLTVDGMDETTVCIGDTMLVGDTCVLQVSQPRQPCWKLSRRWNVADLDAQVRDNGYSGWYLRVLREGSIRAGDVVTLADRPYPEWTVSATATAMYRRDTDHRQLQFLAACPLLSDHWRGVFEQRLTGHDLA